MLNKDYALKAEVLKNKYSKIFEEFAFAACKDDRIVAVNVLNQLLTACKGMTITNNPYICNAVNQAISQDCERIDRIVTRFTGRVYKDCRWQNKSEIMEDDAGEITEEMIEKGVEKCLVNFIVHNESDTGHIADILQNGQQQEQDQHLRHKAQHCAPPNREARPLDQGGLLHQ